MLIIAADFPVVVHVIRVFTLLVQGRAGDSGHGTVRISRVVGFGYLGIELNPVAVADAIDHGFRYELRAEPFRELADWLEPYRWMWEDRLDRLGRYLDEEASR